MTRMKPTERMRRNWLECSWWCGFVIVQSYGLWQFHIGPWIAAEAARVY